MPSRNVGAYAKATCWARSGVLTAAIPAMSKRPAAWAANSSWKGTSTHSGLAPSASARSLETSTA